MRQRWVTGLSLVLAGVVMIMTTSAEPIAIKNNEGVSVTLTKTGKIIGFAIDGKNLLSNRGFSGIQIEDVVSKQTAKIVGHTTQVGNELCFDGESKGLKLKVTARMKSMGDYIAMNINVKDLTGQDRAIRARVVLTLKDRHWIWCNDLNSNYEAKIGECNMNPGTYAGHIQSAYPFAAIACDDDTGLAIGWPMVNPRFYTESYVRTDNGFGTLEICADLGLAKETTKFPSSADFDVILYRFDGRNQFRGALAKYYQIYPDIFDYSFDEQGLWVLWLGDVEDYARKSGVVYHEAEFDLGGDGKRLTRDDQYGFMSLQYIEPWGYWHPFPTGWIKSHVNSQITPAPFETVFEQKPLENYVTSDLGSKEPADRFPGTLRGDVAQAILNTAVWRDLDGNWMTHFSSPGDFRWGERKGGDSMVIIANPDPDLPSPNRWDIAWKGQVEYVEQIGKKANAKLDGVYVDSLAFGLALDRMNFRRDQWKYADIPLTFTTLPDGKVVPAQAMMLADVEFMRKLHRECRKRNWLTLGNGFYPIYAVSAPWFDVLGAGEHGAIPEENTRRIDQWIHGYFRALARRKPVSSMDYALSFSAMPPTRENAANIVESRVNYYLLYGIYPGTANSWRKAPDCLQKLDLFVPVLEKYFPIFRAINIAGWEPITMASVDQKGVLIERWGSDVKQGLYFTLFNSTDKTVMSQVTVDLDRLKTAGGSSAKELVSGKAVPVATKGENLKVTVSINPGRCVVVQIKE